MNQSNKVRMITDGAVICAIYALLLLASRFIGGLLEEWLYFLLPIPITVFGYKYSLKSSIVPALASIGIAFILINPLTTLFYVLPTVGLGIFYPLVLKKSKNSVLEILFATGMSLLCMLFSTVLFGWVYNYNIIDDTLALYNEISQMIEKYIDISAYQTTLKALFISIIPSSLIVTALLQGLLLNLLTNILLQRLKMKKDGIFKQMITIETIPSSVGYTYILIFILAMASIANIGTDKQWLFIMEAVIINLMIVFSFVMIYEGLHLIAKYTRKKGIIWLYFLAVVSVLILPIFVIVIGVVQNITHISLKI